MMLEYEIEHTTLNGKRLQFKGTGGSLFVERFRWIFFTIITLGIYAFWIPVKKTKWILSNIYFEDEGYVRGESYFDGSVLQLVGINIICCFLTIASFGILYPFTECIKLRWIAKHSIINRKKIVFSGNGLSLFGHYILWLFLTIITLGIYGLWLKIKMIKWKVNNSHIKVVGEEESKDSSIIIMVIVFIALLIIWIIFFINNPIDFNNFGTNRNTEQQVDDNYYPNNYYPNNYDSTYSISNYN